MDSSVEERFAGSAKGNGLFARKRFIEGETLFEELPLVSCQFAWNEDCNYLSCELCLKPLETAEENARRLSGDHSIVIPFPEIYAVDKSQHVKCVGCSATYCSSKCKDLAWSEYHETLCHPKTDKNHPLEVLRETWKKMQYPPESFNVMILAKLAAMYKQKDPVGREKLLASLKKFQHEAVNKDDGLLLKILGEHYKNRVETLRNLFSSFFNDALFRDWWSWDNFVSIFAIFARNAQGVGTTSFGMWQTLIRSTPHWNQEMDNLVSAIYSMIEDKTGVDFMDNEGSALFTLQRACNHSCNPNTRVFFPYNSSTLRLVASRPIESGEEIFITYLEECQLQHSRHSRQKTLREFYLFNCSCTKCREQADQADISSDEEDGWTDEDDPMEEE